MLFHTERWIRRGDSDFRGDEQGSTCSSACLDAHSQAPSLASPVSACASLLPRRTCLACPAPEPSSSCSSACLDAPSQAPSLASPASASASLLPPHTFLAHIMLLPPYSCM